MTDGTAAAEHQQWQQQQTSECGHVEEAVDVKECNVIEYQLPEDEEDLTGVSEQTSNVSSENHVDCQPEIEVKSLQESKITNELLSESCGQEEQRQEDKNQHDVIYTCLNIDFSIY